MQNKFKMVIPLAIIMLLLVSCSATVSNWTPHQKANFFMKSWRAEKASYDIMNQMENKPPELISNLKVKQSILEKSRIPIRSYATIVKEGGSINPSSEDEILGWLRQLQVQLVYK